MLDLVDREPGETIMKVYSIILISVLAIFADAGDVHYDLRDAPFLFYKYVKEYQREYKDTEDLLIHYVRFVSEIREINIANELSETATFDINQFTDYTDEEMKPYVDGVKIEPELHAAQDRRVPQYRSRYREY